MFSSPLSGNQEVSAYGNDGEGDSGDHWYVDCGGDFWERDDDIRLKHADTGGWVDINYYIIKFLNYHHFLLDTWLLQVYHTVDQLMDKGR